jgi:sugar lactone lactonase YvrE
LDQPKNGILDAAGNLLFSDAGSHRIRRIDAVTGFIATVAGNGEEGFSGEGGPATDASLNGGWVVSLDNDGNIFIADRHNRRIRRVDSVTGIITTVVGNGTQGYSGDGGQAIEASLDRPRDVLVDSSGNLYIADSRPDVVRFVDAATGIITTIAGTGTSGFSGDGGPATAAQFDLLSWIALDDSRHLLISDSENHRIRQLDLNTGIITTIAGTGNEGIGGDGGPAISATFNRPRNLNVDAVGNIFVSDWGNHRIRKIDGNTRIITTVAGKGAKPASDN